jgi:hypothetical protein
MAVVQGIKEKVHLPIYDCVRVDAEEQLRDVEKSSTLKFFIDVQGKTKLETNLQSASLLPHYNTFEARALRVVFSDLPPEFPDDDTATTDSPVLYTDSNGDDVPLLVDSTGEPNTTGSAVSASIELGLADIVELIQEADDSSDGTAELLPTDDSVTLSAPGVTADIDADAVQNAGGFISLSEDDLYGMLDDLPESTLPLDAQILPNNGDGSILSKLIYNTVTTFYVGEKVMIEMPTWFFPSGAGPYSEGGKFSTHGEPNPTATFRFAEPIFIDKQQNFRVEIDIPDGDTVKELQRIYGPFFIWVVLDGYMTRGVQ